MDVERIERALREGPPDEPAYIPGGFRRSSAGVFAFAAVAVAAALIIGVGVGFTLDALRGGGFGTQPPAALDPADLQGTWLSDEILFQEWVDALLERGFTTDEIAANLDDNPFNRSMRYELRVTADEMTMRGSIDGAPMVLLTSDPYTILSDGRVRIGGEASECQPVVDVVLDGARLTFSQPELQGCPVDDRIAGVGFFELTGYDRVDE